MQPFRMALSALLVIAVLCVIVAGTMFSVGSAFYALTALSELAFAAFLLGGGVTIGGMLLLNRFAMPVLRREWQGS